MTVEENEVKFLASIPNQEKTGEPKHTSGHDTSVITINQNSYMCPECGKIFNIKDAAERHLHGVHLEHLRKVHNEFHGKDVLGHHVE